jgi:hypothetical protein
MFAVRPSLSHVRAEEYALTLLRLQYNPYKLRFINDKVPDGTTSTVYRCGPMIDLCRGPHIPHTGRVKSIAVLKVRLPFSSSVYRTFLTFLYARRTLPPTSSVTPPTTPSSASTVSLSPTRSK